MAKKPVDKLYVIVHSDSNEVLTPDTFKKYWPNYDSNSLQGWRPAKKIYYTPGHAKSGFNFIPEAIKKSCKIAVFTYEEDVIDGEELKKEAAERKKAADKRYKESQIRAKEARIARLERELKEAKNDAS